jgi:chromate transporter
MIHVPIPIPDLIWVFGKIGLLSFGGPAAQIALMHKELVEDHAWVSEQQFISALSFCMLLPGPEAMQLATFSGWRLRGVAGGLIAGVLFVLPGAFVITALAVIYNYFGTVPLVESAFLGIKAAVVIIVVQALLKLSQKALQSRFDYGLAVLAFVSIFLFALPFPVLIASAAVIGLIWAPARPLSPPMPTGRGAASSASQTVWTVLFWGGLWGGPLLGLWLSGNTFLTAIGLFFSKLSLVTFGGAYAVLAYMTQTVVTQFEWLSTTQMIDALGLAETTPGPLILVTQFVAMQAGFKTGSLGLALAAGGIALWMTFIPCFLWVFAGAPYFDRLSQKPKLTAALSGVTAAIIGVIMNLSLWFALHIWFESNTMHSFGPIQILVPELQTLVPASLALTAIAAWALLKRRIGMATVLCSMAALGSAASFTNLI